MSWPTASIDNVDFSGADIYVENRKIGATLGECAVVYTPTVRQYFAGYPSRFRGSEITAEKLEIHFAAVELTPENLVFAGPSANKDVTTSKDTVHFFSVSQPAVYSNVILHKYNPGNKKHYVFTLWRAQITSGISFEVSQDSSSLIVLDVTFEALKTANHNADYLGILEIYDSWTPPSS